MVARGLRRRKLRWGITNMLITGNFLIFCEKWRGRASIWPTKEENQTFYWCLLWGPTRSGGTLWHTRPPARTRWWTQEQTPRWGKGSSPLREPDSANKKGATLVQHQDDAAAAFGQAQWPARSLWHSRSRLTINNKLMAIRLHSGFLARRGRYCTNGTYSRCHDET